MPRKIQLRTSHRALAGALLAVAKVAIFLPFAILAAVELYSAGKASYTRTESYGHKNRGALITIPTNLTRGTPDTLLPIQIERM